MKLSRMSYISTRQMSSLRRRLRRICSDSDYRESAKAAIDALRLVKCGYLDVILPINEHHNIVEVLTGDKK